MPRTQTNTGDSYLSPQQLYDALMVNIEPELVSDKLESLDALYAAETPEDHTLRMERYAKAFAVFEERFGNVMSTWKEELNAFKHKAMIATEQKSQASDTQALSDIDSAIENA